MSDVLIRAEANQATARRVMEACGVFSAWESIGAEVHLVGSLATGLLMKNRDIDFHIYSDRLTLADSFRAAAHLAANRTVERLTVINLLETKECCVEWHAWVLDDENQSWQLDMIHMEKGSYYDGYFERVAARISAVLTPETKRIILELKDAIPETEKVAGIEFYQAVLRDGVRDGAEFVAWRKEHPITGIVDWMP